MSSKKSETLEIRLSQPLKIAFTDRCRARNVSASEALRGLIEGYLEPRPKRVAGRRLHIVVAAVAALGLGATAAPSLARPGPEAVFKTMDRRHVGSLSFEDFVAATSVKTEISPTSQLPFRVFGARPTLRASDAVVTAELRRSILRNEFGLIDTNHDGRIDLDEFRRHYGG